MRNKLINLLLCIAMVSSILVGCNSNTSKSSEEPESESNVKAEAVAKNKEFVTPKWVKSVIDGNQLEF